MRQNQYAWAFGIGCLTVGLLICALLRVLGVPLFAFGLVVLAVALLWLAFCRSMLALGALLAVMPIYPLTLYVARFFGPPLMMSHAVQASDRIALLVVTCILFWRNGIKLKLPDWLLLACFGLATIRLAFGGTPLPLLSDFNFMIAYAAGRVAILSVRQQEVWARRGVWIVAILSILGMSEVFVFGEGPRTILYLAATNGTTDENGTLGGTFHAQGFTGLRESATMTGPIQFASLCMVGLILCWVYRQKLLPMTMIVAGLICTVTRSAWLGTAVAIPLLAVIMDQKKRLLRYAGLVLGLFLIAIPVLGLSDYLFLIKSGQEYSSESHKDSLADGFRYVIEHPLGSGPGNAGSYSTKENDNGVFIEDTYLSLAAEYGIPTALCFVGFLLSALSTALRERTPLGYAAVGILVGFALVMMVAPLHQDFSLASWLWFAVGVAIRPFETASKVVVASESGTA